MIITINLTISTLEQRCFKVVYDNYHQLLAKTNKKLIYFILFLFKKNNNECLKNVSISH